MADEEIRYLTKILYIVCATVTYKQVYYQLFAQIFDSKKYSGMFRL